MQLGGPDDRHDTREDWLWQHRRAATSLAEVEELFPGRFALDRLDRTGIEAAIALYGMRATPYYLSLARVADERDPVWALAVPSPRETVVRPEERQDPIGDEEAHTRPLPALTHRYPDRVLLFPTPVCSVHCRHCFRKRLVGNPDYAVSAADLDAALAYIAARPAIHEVILTGGDPLTLSDGRLLELLARLAAIAHLRSLRLHTRMPVVNPFRITEALADGLAAIRPPVLVVAHFNHAVEVTPAAVAAAGRLVDRGVGVLNQSVLLAGINAEPEAHRELLWALVGARIRPYALHHADLVPGTSHLRTGIEQGRALMRALRGTLPGHAIPHYLLDVPGGHGKVPLDYPWVSPGLAGGHRVETPDGARHEYGGPFL
ncbi:MAG TPA: KamA family radical SAM protein [Planctomycetota bacterium]|nr:KamA family radical SAM protein [Planctomycetota bacterium]